MAVDGEAAEDRVKEADGDRVREVDEVGAAVAERWDPVANVTAPNVVRPWHTGRAYPVSNSSVRNADGK